MVQNHRTDDAELRGRAELSLDVLNDLPLRFERDDTPFDRHGNILGWPQGKEDDDRAELKLLKTALATASVLFLYA